MTPLALLLLTLSGVLAQDWTLVFEDEFEIFNTSKWDWEVTAWGGGNQEFQVYTPSTEHTYVQDGKLYIKPKLLIDSINPQTGEPFGEEFMDSGVLDLNVLYGRCTNPNNQGCRREGAQGNIPPIMSGRLRTAGQFGFKHGRVEIIAKMPVGDWMWPALWMLPEEYRYGGWPYSGEIDITESVSNRDLVHPSMIYAGVQRMGSALHWGTSGQNKFHLTNEHRENLTENYGDYFHKYELEWDENGLILSVDDFEVLVVPNPPVDQNPEWVDFWEFGQPWNEGTENPWEDGTNLAPFDEDFHFLFNVAVGGTNGFIPDVVINHGGRFPKPWNNGQEWFQAQRQFYDRREDWHWTWQLEGDNAAMQVESIRVWQRTE